MGKMSLDTYKETIDQCYGNVEFISLASERTIINPLIDKMLEYSSGKFLNLKINTNASLLNEKKIHAILRNDVRTLFFLLMLPMRTYIRNLELEEIYQKFPVLNYLILRKTIFRG